MTVPGTLRIEPADLDLEALDALDVDSLAVFVGPERPLQNLAGWVDWRLCGALSDALRDRFYDAMDDDFNTPRALALIFDEVRSLNRLLDDKKFDRAPAKAAALKTVCETLGLLQGPPEAFFSRQKERWLKYQGLDPEHVEAWIAKRNEAREQKKWQEADRIREELLSKGVLIEDTPGGTVWKIK